MSVRIPTTIGINHVGTHIPEEPLGRVHTRQNEAEAERVSDVHEAAWVALVSSTMWNSVTLSIVFQN